MKSYFKYGQTASNRDLITSTTTYSNVTKRYFSSLDAEIFIGGERILDIKRIDFTYEEKKLPIYGFNSFIPSKIFVGQKLIQGTFIINFTEVGYIAKLLDKIEESSIAGPYDKVGLSCDVNNADLFKKQFDILIGYGGYNVSEETSYKNTYQKILGVSINGYQQILDVDGEPIYEVYSFIARNLTYDNAYPSNSIVSDTTTTNTTDTTNEIDIEDYELVDANNITNTTDYMIPISLKQIKMAEDTCKIRAIFPDIIDNSDINSIRILSVTVTISDILIDMSKTFKLTLRDNEWNVILSRSDTQKINKRLDTNKYIDCRLDVEIGKSDGKTQTLTSNLKIWSQRADNII